MRPLGGSGPDRRQPSGLALVDRHRQGQAIIAAEFLRSGNWIVPTLYGEPLFTKPPGMYAAIALVSLPVGGVSGDEDAQGDGPATGNLSAQKRNGRKP